MHGLEDPFEVAALYGQQLRQCATAPDEITRDDHFTHRGNAVALEEHVLRATEPDAFGTEAARNARVGRSVGIRANFETTHFVCPTEQSSKRCIGRCVLRRSHTANYLHDLTWRRR